jgi:hypothetical protein
LAVGILEGAPAFVHIPLPSALLAKCLRGVAEDAEEITIGRQGGAPRPEAFHQDHGSEGPAPGAGSTSMSGEVIAGDGGVLTLLETVKRGVEQGPIQGVGVVKIDAVPARGRQGGEVAIEMVEG